MNPNKTPKQIKTFTQDHHTPVRTKTVTNKDGITYNKVIPVRHVIKQEYLTISKNFDPTIGNVKIFTTPKDVNSVTKLLYKNESYGTKNMFRKDTGEIHRIEINIFDPDFTPFTFHLKDSADPTKFTGKYEKLIELRKQVEKTRVIYEINTETRPTEDVLNNYIHVPFIDPFTGREYSLYSRYSGASYDSKLGRVMNLELLPEMIFNLSIENSSLFKNDILDGCQLLFTAIGVEDLS